MVERKPSKLHTRVRFPSPAPVFHSANGVIISTNGAFEIVNDGYDFTNGTAKVTDGGINFTNGGVKITKGGLDFTNGTPENTSKWSNLEHFHK